MQIELTDRQIVEIRQALYAAYCSAYQHYMAYTVFCEASLPQPYKVEQGVAQERAEPEKE